jgi:hypothetical protein
MPQSEHNWLQQLVGEWTFEAEAVMGPGEPPMKSTGTESVRSLGGLWVVCEGNGEMPGGGEATMILTLGFEPRTGRYQGTWIGSMMTQMWVYDGEVDAGGTILTLHTEGPHFGDPSRLASYRETIEIKSRDHRTFSSAMQGDDGEWLTFMTAHYRRAAR